MNKDQNHIDNLFDKARNQQPETSFEEISFDTFSNRILFISSPLAMAYVS